MIACAPFFVGLGQKSGLLFEIRALIEAQVPSASPRGSRPRLARGQKVRRVSSADLGRLERRGRGSRRRLAALGAKQTSPQALRAPHLSQSIEP